MFDVSVWHEAHDYPLLRWLPSVLKALAIHSDPGTHLVRRRSSWELSWRSEALSILNLASWTHWYIRFHSCLSRVRAVTILIWYWTQFRVAHLPYHIQMGYFPTYLLERCSTGWGCRRLSHLYVPYRTSARLMSAVKCETIFESLRYSSTGLLQQI